MRHKKAPPERSEHLLKQHRNAGGVGGGGAGIDHRESLEISEHGFYKESSLYASKKNDEYSKKRRNNREV